MASGALVTAAGAGEGLDQMLTRLLTEQRMKQMADATTASQAETNRSHLANEGIDRDRIAASERERISRDAMTAADHADASASRVRDDGRALGDQIPAGTVIPETDPAVSQMDRAGLGSILRGVKSRPAIDVGPLQPEDKGQAIPVDSRIKLKSFSQAEKTAADDRANVSEADRIRHEKVMENKPAAPDRVLIQTPDGYVRRSDATATLQGGGKVAGPESATTKNRRDMATAVGSHFDDVSSLIDEADSKGLLGPIAGRTFADFMAGKVGSTGNAENDALLGDLRTSMSMIRSGTASLHGRTGANVGIAKDIEKKMDEGHMSAAELKGSLKALKSWVDTYAKKPGAEQSGKADLVFDPASGTFKKPGDD